MGKIRYVLLIFILLFSSVSCLKKEGKEVTTEDAEKLAYDLFDKGKYNKALDYFLVLRYEKTGKDRARALFYIGSIYYKEKDWEDAIETFKELLDTYQPDESYFEPAAYMMAVSYYKMAPKSGRDMSGIDRSIDGLSYYLQMFPNGEHYNEIYELKESLEKRKARYILSVGDFYFNRKEYDAAKITYETILDEYPDFILEDELLYKIALCYIREGDKDIAKNYFDRIDEDSPFYKKLEKYFSE